MRAFAFAAALFAATTGASAADVNITCIESTGQRFIGVNMFPVSLNGPWNFTITEQGLETPWGGHCGLMKGEVSAARVSVSCSGDVAGSPNQFKKTVEIDRHLGTYRESFELNDPAAPQSRSFISGTCQRRETF